MTIRRPARALAAAVALLAAPLAAQQATTPIVFDAVAQPPAPTTGFLKMGTDSSPAGHVVRPNSRYLTRDGRPWLPVMGEFHFSRYPAKYWEEEILKMKAGGVDIIASYVIWIHHEEVEGQFDWAGQKDIRRFARLAAKHGMLFYPRVGPWSHAEVRNGGFPDWLVRRVGVANLRSDDSAYMRSVDRFYGEIARQLEGLLWKDGGPIVGIQLENEYAATGPGRGAGHVLHLKEMARRHGLDVPLYTVTGWDNAVWPAGEVVPLFGGYMDMPWDARIDTLPPNETYFFRFGSRVSGNMGFQGAAVPPRVTPESLAAYPFFGAEYGGGIQVTYHRRPLLSVDDVAAMLPVQLGSGVNLYGYYMFHGGTNPPGRLTTLMESQATGYPTDVPVKSYDFQAPLSEFGEMRPTFRRLKGYHQLLAAFGDELAPMVVRRPDVVPSGATDTTTPRAAARTLGDRGFLFFNNHLRHYPLAARRGVQFTVRLPGGEVRVPATPVDVPSGAYFIWPVNMDVAGARLRYATAQPLTRVDDERGVPVYVFFATPGIAPELAFDAATVAGVEAPRARVAREGDVVRVTGLRPGAESPVTVRVAGGRSARVLVLTREQADNAWRVRLGGVDRLVLSAQDLFVSGDTLHLRARGTPRFALAVLPALRQPPARAGLVPAGRVGPFMRYTATLPDRPVTATVTRTREARPVPPVRRANTVTWRKDSVATTPDDSLLATRAAEWRIAVPATALRGVSDVFLELRYTGDVARLYAGDSLLTDDFFKGSPWRVGLKRWERELARGPLTLRVLPLRGDAPVFLERGRPARDAQVAELAGVDAIPEYELVVVAPGGTSPRQRSASGATRQAERASGGALRAASPGASSASPGAPSGTPGDAATGRPDAAHTSR